MVRAFAKIPEAINHPWELSLPGLWPDVHGPHLTLLASEDIPANGLRGPVTPLSLQA
jgi:hypothetical protein